MDGAVGVMAKVGMLKGVLVSDMDAMVGDEDCKPMCQIWVRAE